MNWYAAHIVMFVQLKRKAQENYPLWENVVLVRASSAEEAFEKAERIGRDAEGDDAGSFTWDEKPAEWVFAGVRKIVACEDSETRPGDGTEITYIEMQATSKAAIAKLVEGRPVSMRIAERFQPELVKS